MIISVGQTVRSTYLARVASVLACVSEDRQACSHAAAMIDTRNKSQQSSVCGYFLTGVRAVRKQGVTFSDFFFLRQRLRHAHLCFVDPVAKVAGVAVLHDDAQAVLVQEGVSVPDDVGVAHASEEFHLVPTGLLLLGGDILQLDDLVWSSNIAREGNMEYNENDTDINIIINLDCIDCSGEGNIF